MRAGEEIDLGYKLRYAGFEIYSIPAVMAKHDADLRSFGQIWRRSLRDGYGEMQVIMKHWHRTIPPLRGGRGVSSVAKKDSECKVLRDGALLENTPLTPPKGGIASSALRFLQSAYKSFRNFKSWPQGYVWKMNAQIGLFVLLATLLVSTQQWFGALALCCAPPALITRKTLRYGRQTGMWRVSFWYSLFLYVLMIPILLGEIHCLWERMRARLVSQNARPAMRQRLRLALK